MNFEKAEEQFREDLIRLRMNAVNALYPMYYLEAFVENAKVDLRDELVAGFRRYAPFWHATLYAWQCAAIVGLGRVYDERKDTFRLRDVIAHARLYKPIFHPTSLRQRVFNRLQPSNSVNDAARYADEFIRELRPIGDTDFERVENQLQGWTDLYTAKYQDIRHQHFAHLTADSTSSLNRLFEQTLPQELKALLEFPIQLHEALCRLYQNGSDLEILPVEDDGVVRARAQIRQMTRQLVGISAPPI